MLPVKDSVGDRMKHNYENVYRLYLTHRTPVIIRVDMRSGHTFTSFMQRPYDSIFMESMHKTAIALSEQIMNVELAYTQSDEISLLLVDYKKLTTEQWFDGNIQKMASIAASMATIEFNKAYTHSILSHSELSDEAVEQYTANINTMNFDARVFNIPESEVTNYFVWRQQDCYRNSIEMAGRYYFSQAQLQHVSLNGVLEKLRSIGINWSDYPVYFRRGAVTIKESYTVHDQYKDEEIERFRWVIDSDTPLFTQNRDYIGSHLKMADDH